MEYLGTERHIWLPGKFQWPNLIWSLLEGLWLWQSAGVSSRPSGISEKPAPFAVGASTATSQKLPWPNGGMGVLARLRTNPLETAETAILQCEETVS